MRTALLVVPLLFAAACQAATAPNYVASSSPSPVATAQPISAVASSAPPTATSTPLPSPLPTREIAGMTFAVLPGAAELYLDPAISRQDDELIASTVAADIPAVEREFERTFPARPVIYVFGAVESYTEGFVRVFGYAPSTATFVADNSVSFFEPSLRIIAVNWPAVRDRQPVAAIRHELTHLLTLDACAPRCDLVPAWLNEGQARLAEAMVPGADWRLLRVRYEAASMAITGTILPLNALVSQFSWNALTEWAGYFKYQEAARAVELLREDVGGTAPMARIYERLRRGQNLAQAYASLTDRTFDDFVTTLAGRMRAGAPAAQGLIVIAPTSYLLYGFPPSSTITIAVSGPRASESTPLAVSPFGSNVGGLAPTRPQGVYTVSAQTESEIFTVTVRKLDAGAEFNLQ